MSRRHPGCLPRCLAPHALQQVSGQGAAQSGDEVHAQQGEPTSVLNQRRLGGEHPGHDVSQVGCQLSIRATTAGKIA